MTYPISQLDGCDCDAVAKLKAVGIRTTERLLEAANNVKARRALAEKTGLDEKIILHFATMADRMRIPGLGREYASLLEAAGVATVKELKYRNPANLAKAMAQANKDRKLVRVLPSDKAVERWVENAKKLQIKITY